MRQAQGAVQAQAPLCKQSAHAARSAEAVYMCAEPVEDKRRCAPAPALALACAGSQSRKGAELGLELEEMHQHK